MSRKGVFGLKFQKVFTILSIVILAALMNPGTISAQTVQGNFPKNIAVGTAAAGGAWYPIGAVISDIISRSNLGTQAATQTTGGGVENCKLVSNGDTEIAITLGYLAYNAQNGLTPYNKKMPNISGLFGGLSTGVMQVLVNGDSPIKSYKDLKGKKVAVGPAGGGAIITLDAALEAFGIKYSQITPSYVTYDEGVSMMTDHSIDAAIVYGGIPTPAVKTLQASHKSFRILNLTEAEQTSILKKYTYFSPVKIPSAMYGLSEDVLTIGTPNEIIVNSKLSDDFVYQLCKLLLSDENIKKIQESQPSAKEFSLANAAKTSVKLHPGAEKYYKEIGLLK
jgi:TRAP transporter TAXI family solute receptor